MCGIFGYFGFNSVEKTIQALKFLEYRGYDSSGIALIDKGLHLEKSLGPPTEINWNLPSSYACIGHTRWATHGNVSLSNAHPHVDCQRKIAVVHNGTLENYSELKKYLESKGHKFISQTDTEVIPHLIEDEIAAGIEIKNAVTSALNKIKGSYALAILTLYQPDSIIVARNSNPIFIGVSNEGKSICSDIPTISLYSQEITSLNPYEIAFVGNNIEIYERNLNRISKKYFQVSSIKDKVSLDGHKTYTEKEIFEQPRTLQDCRTISESEIKPVINSILNSRRLYLVGAGTSYYAALVASYLLREANIPSEAIQSQEFPYKSVIDKNTTCIFFSQSGTTADTNNAILYASQGKKIGIVNVIGSDMERLVEHIAYTRAGPEIGVASTKNFTNQLYLFNLILLKIFEKKGITPNNYERDFYKIPEYVEEILKRGINPDIVDKLIENNPIFLGSGIHYPVALEAALKFKELTYLEAVGYSSGELKHGPLATVHKEKNVVIINPNDSKTKINLEEAKARGAKIISIGTSDEGSDFFIPIPEVHNLLSPIVSIIPAQLLSLRVAEKLQRNVDKPRNLAKSVTVE